MPLHLQGALVLPPSLKIAAFRNLLSSYPTTWHYHNFQMVESIEASIEHSHFGVAEIDTADGSRKYESQYFL